jgi:D-alanyl-D-alanine carboxypeptidase/D-alanyl-D-alanine-endopeptidase (penicillin-binding protein 4)
MPRRLAHLALLVAICALTAAPLQAAPKRKPLSTRIAAILDEPELAQGYWGVEVVSLTRGKPVYGLNYDKLFTPASNTKLFTTAAALALIGPDYKYRTSVETNGLLDTHGRLSGDLLLVGRGDPNLSGRELPYDLRTQRNDHPIKVLEDLADSLVQKGVKYVDGDLIADDSFFAFERYGEGWSQDDLVWGDGAPVSALTINDNVVFVNILPADRAGERAFVSIVPFADYYHVDNRIITTPAGTARRIYFNREPGSTALTLWGDMPLDDGGANQALAIDDPAAFAAQLFRSLLERRGITVYGRQRTHHTELASLSTFSVTATAEARGGDSDPLRPRPLKENLVLANYDSRPLVDDLRVINKVSQNLHAEILLRLLGHEKGTAATVDNGREVVRAFLTKVGVPSNQYVFYDGSGLSRQNLVTPQAMVMLLQYASKQPWATEFRSTLPVAGVDGSLAERFKGPPAQGQVFAKTGSLGGVKSLAGYLTTNHGEQIAFAIISNNLNASAKKITDAIDQIVLTIMDDDPPKKSPKLVVGAPEQKPESTH